MRSNAVTRRGMLRRMSAAPALASAFKFAEPPAQSQAPASGGFNRNSAPSQLKITDMRACTVAANYDYPIIRIDTNQGIYGYGEVFAAGFKGSALTLKAHILGRNPLDIQGILRRIRNSAGQNFWHSGYGAIDLALHDIAGKVYGVPAWRLLGPKLRDQVLLYCDTTGSKDPKVFQKRMLRRKEIGFRFFKMDLYTNLVQDRPGAVDRGVATEKGLGYMCELIAAVRDAVGWDAPLAADHFGNLTVNDAIRYGKAFEPYKLAWAEDFIPQCWLNWRGFKEISGHHYHPGPDRRAGLRTGGGIPGPARQPCGRSDPPRLRGLGRHDRDQAHPRLRRGSRHFDRAAYAGIAHRPDGHGAPGRHAFQLRVLRTPRRGHALVAGSGYGPRKAHHQQGATSACRTRPAWASN